MSISSDKIFTQKEESRKTGVGFGVGAKTLGELSPTPLSPMMLDPQESIDKCLNCDKSEEYCRIHCSGLYTKGNRADRKKYGSKRNRKGGGTNE